MNTSMSGSSSSVADTVLAANARLIDAIEAGDFAAYSAGCADDLTCFEPEARGSRVSGLAFHNFYFKLGGGGGADPTTSRQCTLVEPQCRLVGDGTAAVVTYVRLVQQHGGGAGAGPPTTAKFEETRVYEKRGSGETKGENWICVHFHRSIGT